MDAFVHYVLDDGICICKDIDYSTRTVAWSSFIKSIRGAPLTNPQMKAAPLCMQAATATFREREVTVTETIECLEHDLHKELWELAHKNKKSVDGSDAALLPSARSLHQGVETRSRARSSFLVT